MNELRTTPFQTGYRPQFEFIPESTTSGSIELINMNQFIPPDENIVMVTFVNSDYLGAEFGVGSKCVIREGREILGKGEVLHLIQSNN